MIFTEVTNMQVTAAEMQYQNLMFLLQVYGAVLLSTSDSTQQPRPKH